MIQNMDSVTDSELVILKALWTANTPLTANQWIEVLARTTDWGSSTVRTFITRLHKKGAIRSEQQDVLYFQPAFTEKEYGIHQASKLLREFYSGSAGTLIATLHGQKQLTEEDIADLKRFIDEIS